MTEFSVVDLTNCDREPIHIPGSIQSHGCLIACDVAAQVVLRRSDNCRGVLGVDLELIGRTLNEVVGPSLAHDIRNVLTRTQEGGRSALLFAQSLSNGRCFDIAVHRFRGAAIIEFEAAADRVAQPLELARAMLGRIASVDTAEQLVRDSARLVQALLDYDRVMIYQFGHDGAGKVLSEARRGDLESFLGQYFPASDIPQQARALYVKNTIRIISDTDCERIAVQPLLNAAGEPLDLSFAHLRSVSPVHCEYLRNMGVGASMSISIIVNGQLWGLIACHHYAPRTLSMAQRVAAELFGEFFSLHLNALRHKRSLEAAAAARGALDGFLREAVGAADINRLFHQRLKDFGTLIPCDGLAMWLDGELTTVGTTPPPEAIAELAGFAETVAEGDIWATHQLSAVIADAECYAGSAAGMLIIPLSQRPRDYVFYFRKEVVQTLDWAGNPEKLYATGPLGDRLTPRKSFAIWKETVRGQSPPWTDQEREFAEAVRVALVGVLLRHSELLADERARAEVRQRMLNEELNHRVKNILAVIKSLVSNPAGHAETIEDYVESLRGRIQALSLAHDQVIRGEAGGALHDLLDAELMPYRSSSNDVVLEGPVLWLDARAYSIMALVLHELSTNAAKYGALSQPGGQLSVQWSMDEAGVCDIRWIESGGPRVSAPQRRGFGSVLIDRCVPFDLGGESSIDYPTSGVRARFRLPARFVSIRNELIGVVVDASGMVATTPVEVDLQGRRVLVVEDQMLIALDLEQILRGEGMVVIATATSTREALACLASTMPDAAIVDVNLGDETSAPVARALLERGIPFIFATGYAEDGSVLDAFPDTPVVGKPYVRESMLSQLHQLFGSRQHS